MPVSPPSERSQKERFSILWVAVLEYAGSGDGCNVLCEIDVCLVVTELADELGNRAGY
jgi:hypothetical protein